jgi:hypothetical protein
LKKLILIAVLFILILAKIVFSSLIEVDISEDIKGEVVHEGVNISSNIVKFSTEFSNVGSIAYNARARISIYKNDKLLFNGWSQEKTLMPGDRKIFDIYWYASSPVKYDSKLRVYAGNEIFEDEKKEFQVTETLIPEDNFEIMNFRTYDNYIIFDIKSKNDAKNTIVIPYKYVPSWIFEQKTIEYMRKGSVKTVQLNFYPSLVEPTSLKLSIMAENGKYYSEKTLEMKKEQGIIRIFHSILDSLKLLL